MFGWVFAVVALGAILGFEYALFRYVGTERSPSGRVDGSSPPSDASGGWAAAADAPSSNGVRGVDGRRRTTAEAEVVCRHCGARNADAPTVTFCRSCLDRLD